jgi:hypothetical protein
MSASRPIHDIRARQSECQAETGSYRPNSGHCLSHLEMQYRLVKLFGNESMQTRIYSTLAAIIVLANIAFSGREFSERAMENSAVGVPLLSLITSFIAAFCIGRMIQRGHLAKGQSDR